MRPYWLPNDGYSYKITFEDDHTDLFLNSCNPSKMLPSGHRLKMQQMRSKVYRAAPRFGSPDSEKAFEKVSARIRQRVPEVMRFDDILRSYWLPKDSDTNKMAIASDPADLFLNLGTHPNHYVNHFPSTHSSCVTKYIEQHRDLVARTARKRFQNCPRESGSVFRKT